VSRVKQLLGCGLLVITSGVAGCEIREPPPAPPPTAAKVEQDTLDLAFRDCFLADCERAYAHLSELPATSMLRRSDAYRAVQYRYDADRLLKAEVERDVTKRRALIKAIVDSQVSDPFLRLAATERLGRLGDGRSEEVSLNASTDAPAVAAREQEDLVKKSESKVPADQNEVRSKLEPKIFAGKATAQDVMLLKTVCKAQKDAACLHQLDKLILR